MRLNDIFESGVSYQTTPTVRFRVVGVKTFDELKQHPTVLSRMGSHTLVIDVSSHERVAKAPGENKWNAMIRVFGFDEDEIVCAQSFSDEWLCVAINVMV